MTLHDRADWPSVRELALAAKAAYDRPATISRAGCDVLLLDWRDDLTVVSIRGTAGRHDIREDLKAFPWHDPRLGWCHYGFLRGVRAVWPHLLPRLLGRRSIFTGHSMGGSEASLAAGLACATPGLYPVAVVPFGPARCVLGSTLADLYRSRGVAYARFEEDGDPISEVPAWLSHPVERHIEIGLGWDLELDHPIAQYVRDIAKWQRTHSWADILAV